MNLDAESIQQVYISYLVFLDEYYRGILVFIHTNGFVTIRQLAAELQVEEKEAMAIFKKLRLSHLVNFAKSARISYYSLDYDYIRELTSKAKDYFPMDPDQVAEAEKRVVIVSRDKTISISELEKAAPVSKELNATEIKVMQLICAQKTNPEMAKDLKLSIRTIEEYRSSILKKIEAKNVVGIVIYAIQHGYFKV